MAPARRQLLDLIMEPPLLVRVFAYAVGLYLILSFLVFSPNSSGPETLLAWTRTVILSSKNYSSRLLRAVTPFLADLTRVGARWVNDAPLAIELVVSATWVKAVELHRDLSTAEAVGSYLATLWVFRLVVALGQTIGLTAACVPRAARWLGWTVGMLCPMVKRLWVGDVGGVRSYNGRIRTVGVLLAVGAAGYGVAHWTA